MELLPGLVLRRKDPNDKLKKLSSGAEQYNPLKTFAVKHAQKYEDEGLSRTYILHDTDNGLIAGYITIVCSEVYLESDQDVGNQAEGLHYPYKHWPAIKISRLLVDSRYRREGDLWKEDTRIGEALVKFVIGVALEQICPAAGCRFAVLDAKKDAVGFYKKLGFRILDTEANNALDAPVMFMDLLRADSSDTAITDQEAPEPHTSVANNNTLEPVDQTGVVA